MRRVQADVAGGSLSGRGELVRGAGHGGERVGVGGGLVWDVSIGATTESYGAVFWLGKGVAERLVVPQPVWRAQRRSRLFQSRRYVERHRVSLRQGFSIVQLVPYLLPPHESACSRAWRMVDACRLANCHADAPKMTRNGARPRAVFFDKTMV